MPRNKKWLHHGGAHPRPPLSPLQKASQNCWGCGAYRRYSSPSQHSHRRRLRRLFFPTYSAAGTNVHETWLSTEGQLLEMLTSIQRYLDKQQGGDVWMWEDCFREMGQPASKINSSLRSRSFESRSSLGIREKRGLDLPHHHLFPWELPAPRAIRVTPDLNSRVIMSTLRIYRQRLWRSLALKTLRKLFKSGSRKQVNNFE